VRNLEKFFSDIFLYILKFSILRQDISPDKIDHSSVKNILVVVRHQMGDMLCVSPMMRSLRVQYPGARIILVTKSSTNFKLVFKDDNAVADEVIDYENGFENFLNLIQGLRKKKIDLAVVPSSVVFSVTNHLIAYYSRAKIRVGAASINTLDNKADFLLNIKSDFQWESKKIHVIERNLDIIRQIGIEPQEKGIRIILNKENRDFADKFFSENFPDSGKSVIGFHPGAAKPGNVWAPEKYAELAFIISEKLNSYIFISEGPSDAQYANQMASLLNNKYNTGTFKRHHGVLMNDIALINKLKLFVTNDTGVMHLVSGLNSPVIALFGPTKAYMWGPLGNLKYSIQSSAAGINDISVEKVLNVCMQILDTNIR
jgi:lipopolysaccharide heptosyltransferase II